MDGFTELAKRWWLHDGTQLLIREEDRYKDWYTLMNPLNSLQSRNPRVFEYYKDAEYYGDQVLSPIYSVLVNEESSTNWVCCESHTLWAKLKTKPTYLCGGCFKVCTEAAKGKQMENHYAQSPQCRAFSEKAVPCRGVRFQGPQPHLKRYYILPELPRTFESDLSNFQIEKLHRENTLKILEMNSSIRLKDTETPPAGPVAPVKQATRTRHQDDKDEDDNDFDDDDSELGSKSQKYSTSLPSPTLSSSPEPESEEEPTEDVILADIQRTVEWFIQDMIDQHTSLTQDEAMTLMKYTEDPTVSCTILPHVLLECVVGYVKGEHDSETLRRAGLQVGKELRLDIEEMFQFAISPVDHVLRVRNTYDIFPMTLQLLENGDQGWTVVVTLKKRLTDDGEETDENFEWFTVEKAVFGQVCQVVVSFAAVVLAVVRRVVERRSMPDVLSSVVEECITEPKLTQSQAREVVEQALRDRICSWM